MTSHDDFDLDFDRRLTAWLEAIAPRSVPEPLTERILARTATTRRRPVWAIPERWIPMSSISTQAVATGHVPWRTVALVGLLAAALVGGAIIAAGSRSPRLAPPFGPAANGTLAWSQDGKIVAAESLTGTPTVLVEDVDDARWPWFSPDGGKVTFVRGETSAATGGELWIAEADGSSPRKVGDLGPDPWWEWAPYGDVVVIAAANGPGSLTIARSDGTDSETIATGLALVQTPIFRPPDGDVLTFRGQEADGTWGLYQVGRDGSGLVRLELDPGFQTDEYYDINSEHYFFNPTWSADGDRLIFFTLEPDPASPAGPGHRIHVAEVADDGAVLAEETLEFDAAMDDELSPNLLPDEDTIVYSTIEGALHEVWIGSLSGASPSRPLGIHGSDFISTFVSPDATQVLAFPTAGSVVVVDLDTLEQTPVAFGDDVSWQRRAP